MRCLSTLILGLLFSLPGWCAAVSVAGKVVDENGTAVPGVRVELRADGQPLHAASSDIAGNFTLDLPGPGDYSIRALRQGFFLLTGQTRSFVEGANPLTITLNHLQELAESIDVVYSPPQIDLQQPAEHKELDNVEIQTVPFPAPQDFRNAFPLLNGVVQDTAGRLHFNGGATEQTNFAIDGFHVSDPVNGRLEARLSIDSISSMEVESSRISAESGRGSAGTVDVKTKMGDDRLRFGGTNFIPGVSTEQGLHINKWTPRLELSGPLAKGRAWFYDGFDAFYDLDTVSGLPRGQNRTQGLTTSNLSRFQVNLTPANILSVSFLVNHSDRTRYGLSFLNPLETTTNRLSELYFGNLRDQIYFHGGALIEFGFADSRGVLSDRPQGTATYLITPAGNRGNYFANLDRHFYRQQWLANAVLPTAHLAGEHQIKIGLSFERESFHQEVLRHDYQVLRDDGSLARQVEFDGDPFQQRKNFAASWYAQDRWTFRPGLMLEAGLRADWNEIVRTLVWGPRVAVVWAPARLRDTKFSAGYGIFYDATSLGMLTRHQDQFSLSTFFPRIGPSPPPVVTGFLVDEHNLRAPRFQNASVSVERKLPFEFFGKASYMRRTGTQGFTFLPAPFQPGVSLYQLSNSRRDVYDALELAVRRTFAKRFEWWAGYTRSSTRTNAVVDYSLENPIFSPQMPGNLAWDTPNRFLTWGWAPAPKQLLPEWMRWLLEDTDVAYLLEYRTGFPFSAVNEEGFLVGRANSLRLPGYFNINLHLERRFRALHYLWAWRFGFNNLTNNGNPNVVNNNVDSPAYLTYGRGQLRAFSVRLRFMGKR